MTRVCTLDQRQRNRPRLSFHRAQGLFKNLQAECSEMAVRRHRVTSNSRFYLTSRALCTMMRRTSERDPKKSIVYHNLNNTIVRRRPTLLASVCPSTRGYGSKIMKINVHVRCVAAIARTRWIQKVSGTTFRSTFCYLSKRV